MTNRNVYLLTALCGFLLSGIMAAEAEAQEVCGVCQDSCTYWVPGTGNVSGHDFDEDEWETDEGTEGHPCWAQTCPNSGHGLGTCGVRFGSQNGIGGILQLMALQKYQQMSGFELYRAVGELAGVAVLNQDRAAIQIYGDCEDRTLVTRHMPLSKRQLAEYHTAAYVASARSPNASKPVQ